jgi:hypothetical protein
VAQLSGVFYGDTGALPNREKDRTGILFVIRGDTFNKV